MKAEAQPFIDYYAVLQVDWKCDAKLLEAAYRQLAKMYHPDHPETADVEKFNAVIQAYAVLRHPDERAAYDDIYAAQVIVDGPAHASGAQPADDEATAVSDADAHATILLHLYKVRRERAQDAGVAGYYVQELLNCSDETFEFHRWYLKAKGFIEITEHGTLAITIEGVDHVIAMSRTTMKEKLRIAQG